MLFSSFSVLKYHTPYASAFVFVSVFFVFIITIQPVLSAVAGEAMVGCSYLRSGKKVWVVLNLPTAKVPLGENFADALGVGL